MKNIISDDELMQSERFLINPNEFIFPNKKNKVLNIKKSENIKFNEAGFVFTPRSHNKKSENIAVKDAKTLMEDQEKELIKALEKFYKEN